MIEPVKKYFWFCLIGVIILIFVWQYSSGWSQAKKFYKQAVSGLKSEEALIVKNNEEYIKSCESEITRLQADIDKGLAEKRALKIKADQSEATVLRLKENIYDLQKKLDSIVISDDPDALISDLNRRGLRSIRKARPD